MKFKNIIFKNGVEAVEESVWVKDILIEDEKEDFYPLEFITIDEVRKYVKRNSFILSVPYRLIVNNISLEFIFETIQKLENEDFFQYHQPLCKPTEEEKKRWSVIKNRDWSKENR